MSSTSDNASLRYPDGMERADLEMVVALDVTGSLSAAAERLHTAQPALSRRLAALERSLGGRLFDRGRHGSSPTPEGRLLVERARSTLTALHHAESDTRAALAGHGGSLRIGAAPTLGAELLPAALARHRQEHPEVVLELEVSGDNPRLRALVADGRLDVAVAVLSDAVEPGLRVATSAPQPMVVALPPGHPLAERARIPRADLTDMPMVALRRGEGMRTVLDELFADLGHPPEIGIEVGEREMLMPMVAAGLGATVLPARFARQRAGSAVELRPLSPPLSRTVGAVVRSGPRSRLVEDFVATLRHTWPTD